MQSSGVALDSEPPIDRAIVLRTLCTPWNRLFRIRDLHEVNRLNAKKRERLDRPRFLRLRNLNQGSGACRA